MPFEITQLTEKMTVPSGNVEISMEDHGNARVSLEFWFNTTLFQRYDATWDGKSDVKIPVPDGDYDCQIVIYVYASELGRVYNSIFRINNKLVATAKGDLEDKVYDYGEAELTLHVGTPLTNV